MKKPGFILFSLFAFCFLLLGCSKNITISEVEHYPKPLLKPLPLKIGVYYNDDFRKYEILEISAAGLNIRLGKANIALFDYILPHVFEEVTPVQHLSEANEDMGNLDIILEPSITSYSCNLDFITDFSKVKCQVDITYAITFYSPNSMQLGTWSINAEGFAASSGIGPLGALAEDATQIAMRDLAAQFMTGICKDMATKELFGKYCNK
jgi:hypothetical protein